jgi:hypothetical protein
MQQTEHDEIAATKFYWWRSMMSKSDRVLSPFDRSSSEPSDHETKRAGESPHPGSSTLAVPERDRRWTHITRALGGDPGATRTRSTSVRARGRAASPEQEQRIAGSQNASVRVLEHSTPLRAFISWRDSTSCCYGYQLWRQTTSRRAGVCALSGAVIHRGDEIFQPFTRDVRPGNATAMILAVYIDCPEFSA